jgi:hypothetical protein
MLLPQDLARMAIAGAVPVVVEPLDPWDLLDNPADRVAVSCDHTGTRKSGSPVVG